jgi:hypothetical protein
MHNKSITIAVAIFVLLILGMFIFAYLKKSELRDETPVLRDDEEQKEAGPYDYIDRIEAKHFYSDGTHTLVGEVAMPTPCDLLTWDTFIAESFPEQVRIDFTVINNAEVCTQVVTPQRFKVEFDASESAVIRGRLEGRDIELNLIPASEEETPDDFEIFIKG